MDFYAEQEKRKQKALAEIAQLVDEHYQLSHQVESSQKRMAEIDKLVAEREARLYEIDQSQRNFNSYLAVKEGALTLDDVKKGVEDARGEEPKD
jgi:septal ring factor EnvC (AmiA/AmiB activator)